MAPQDHARPPIPLMALLQGTLHRKDLRNRENVGLNPMAQSRATAFRKRCAAPSAESLGTRKGCSDPAVEPLGARKRCSKFSVGQCALELLCARKACSGPAAKPLGARTGSAPGLLWSHCAVEQAAPNLLGIRCSNSQLRFHLFRSHCTLLHCTLCADTHGFTLVYVCVLEDMTR